MLRCGILACIQTAHDICFFTETKEELNRKDIERTVQQVKLAAANKGTTTMILVL